jgi:hypothetical protein
VPHPNGKFQCNSYTKFDGGQAFHCVIKECVFDYCLACAKVKPSTNVPLDLS